LTYYFNLKIENYHKKTIAWTGLQQSNTGPGISRIGQNLAKNVEEKIYSERRSLSREGT